MRYIPIFGKSVIAILTAVVLGFATLGQSLAFTIKDAEALGPAATATVDSIIEYTTGIGEEVTLYEGDKYAQFIKGLEIFASVPPQAVPAGSVKIAIVGSVDPSDGQKLVAVFNVDNKATGFAWFPAEILDSVMEYVKQGS